MGNKLIRHAGFVGDTVAGLIVEKQPAAEPVSLSVMKVFLRVSFADDDELIGILTTAAREACEAFTGRSFVQKGYKLLLDAFPYFTDTAQGQQAYPPAYYAYPRYSTTLWNYSQMIKLFAPPVVSVDRISYIGTDGQFRDLLPGKSLWYPGNVYKVGEQITDPNQNVQTVTVAGTSSESLPTFATGSGTSTNDGSTLVWHNDGPTPKAGYIVSLTEPARVFPGPAGSNWPGVLYSPDSVQVHYTAGYSADDKAVPGVFKTAIMLCVANWYENREAAQSGQWSELPNHIKMLLWSKRILDFAPTRG